MARAAWPRRRKAIPIRGRRWATTSAAAYHNPAETRITKDNAATLRLKWTLHGGGLSTGQPVIAEGKVFVIATGGTYAIDLEKGTQVWARMDLTGTSSVAYHDGAIYVHTAKADLYKLKASDGTTVWGPMQTYDNAQADGMSSPIVAGGKVIVGHSRRPPRSTWQGMLVADRMAARGGVFAADIATGMEWRYYTAGRADGERRDGVVDRRGRRGRRRGLRDDRQQLGRGGRTRTPSTRSRSSRGAPLWKKQVRAGDVWSLMGGATGEDTDFGANPIVAEFGGRKMVAGGDKGSVFWALDPMTGRDPVEAREPERVAQPCQRRHAQQRRVRRLRASTSSRTRRRWRRTCTRSIR